MIISMKRFVNIVRIISLCLITLLPMQLSAQASSKKKVAVYVTGAMDESYKKVIGAKMVAKIIASSDFTAVERTSDFLNALQQEQDYSISGEVRDSQIAKIGQKLGVKYVAVADVSEVLDECYIASRLINVETGEIIATTDASSPVETMQQLTVLAEKVASGLTGNVQPASAGVVAGALDSTGTVETFSVNGVTFDMIRVDGGSFMMGSSDPEANSDERPVHSETVPTFWIGKTEVTQALWLAVMGSNPSNFRGDNLPVEKVSWFMCQEFVERLSNLTGRVFRLPTEAEWEYAARGGRNSRGYKYSGGNDLWRLGWYDENSSRSTHPVGTKLPNELGIYDMSGNVWEWTADLYSSNYSLYRNGGRVNRGGGWSNGARSCRAALRNSSAPSDCFSNVGLRLAL